MVLAGIGRNEWAMVNKYFVHLIVILVTIEAIEIVIK